MQNAPGRVSRALVAFGANLGDPARTLARAVGELSSLGSLAAVSPVYRTRPIGPPQPDYLNGVVDLRTPLRPRELLHGLQEIELAHGRIRTERFGPRTLDLDLIWYEDEVSDDPELRLPHPRAHEREFVLRPLCDIDGSLVLHGRPAREWLALVAGQGVERAGLSLAP
jgi:2-amino-4-hydroxy-6-hydroxymethyldihydropteridine diphosphokinase